MNSCISLIFRTFLVLNFIIVSVKAQTDSSAKYTINKISIKGNKKTKDRIIIRELVKKEGDTLTLKYLPKIIRRSEFNIFNTQLFIYDSIQCKINDTLKTIDYAIKVKERWYIWPIAYVEFLDRNVNTWWDTRDLTRLNYAAALSLDNFTGVKDRLILVAKTGFSNQFGFNYRLPYLNKQQSIGAYSQFLYTEFNKLHYITLTNKQQFINGDKAHLRYEHSIKTGIFYRPHLFFQHAFDLCYYNITVTDSITDLNTNYFSPTNRHLEYTSLQYKLTFDKRDNKVYPLRGKMIELNVVKDGVEINDRSKPDLTQCILTVKNFRPLSGNIYFANMIRARYLYADRVPFYFNQALGYSNYIRGYERNVIDGQNYILVKNSLRFQFIRKRYKELDELKKVHPFSTVPFQAYLNLFYDGGYVQENFYKHSNVLSNSWQHGYGIGLDMATYYDLVIRLEYSFNMQNQNGIYIHLTSGF